MNRDSRDMGFVGVVGVVLVVVGGALLFGRILTPILGPLTAFASAVGHLLWPLVLIAAGALLLASAIGGGGERRSIGGVYRSRTDRMVGGVLGGLAERLGVDPTLVRIAFAVIAVFTGLWAAAILYAVAAVVLPEGPSVAGDPVASPPPPPMPASAAPTPPGAPGE